MNVLSDEKRAMILRALCEGNSIRATARLTGTAKRTVSNLLRDMGAHAKNYHDRMVTDVATEQVQADEIWAFVGCKERQVPQEKKGQGRGDAWTFTAICRELEAPDRLAARASRSLRLSATTRSMSRAVAIMLFAAHAMPSVIRSASVVSSPAIASRVSWLSMRGPASCTASDHRPTWAAFLRRASARIRWSSPVS